jgi:hypothetical protein
MKKLNIEKLPVHVYQSEELKDKTEFKFQND